MTPCDVSAIPESRETWRRGPVALELDQVHELLQLIDRSRVDGVVVAANFIFRRIQPCKERVHPGFEYAGTSDPTRESPDILTSDEIKVHA